MPSLLGLHLIDRQSESPPKVAAFLLPDASLQPDAITATLREPSSAASARQPLVRIPAQRYSNRNVHSLALDKSGFAKPCRMR